MAKCTLDVNALLSGSTIVIPRKFKYFFGSILCCKQANRRVQNHSPPTRLALGKHLPKFVNDTITKTESLYDAQDNEEGEQWTQ
jgi:hypothetical protein